MKSQLRDKTERVAELEENLVGKQLALDKIIEENQKLQKTIAEINKQGVRVLKFGAMIFVLPATGESQTGSSPDKRSKMYNLGIIFYISPLKCML